MKKQLKHFRHFSKTHKNTVFPALVSFVAVAALGVYVLQSSFAAGESVAVNASQIGTPTGNASIVDDSLASTGKALQFGASGTDPGTDPGTGGGGSLEPGGGIIPAGVSLLHDGSIGSGGWSEQWDEEGGSNRGIFEDVNDGPGRENVMKVTLNPGEERAEVRADATELISQGDEWWMVQSVKFPAGFDNPADGWFHLWQVHAGWPTPDGSPPVSLTIEDDSLAIANDRTGDSSKIGPLPIGEWKDYIIHIKFSTGSDGYVEVWEDGVQTVDRTNRETLAAENTSYFKYGIYAGFDLSHAGVVLHDNMKIYTP